VTHYDWREVLWSTVFGPLDQVAKSLGLYTKTTTDPDEFVGTVDSPERDVEHTLAAIDGVGRSLLSSLHVRTRDDGTVQSEDSAYVYRDSIFAPDQTHILVYSNGDGTTDLYAHYEPNPWTRPIDHYFGNGVHSDGEGVRRARRILFDQFVWLWKRPGE